MRALGVRGLDALVLALLLLGVVLVATGGFDVPLGSVRLPLRRVEDLLVAVSALALIRHALCPYTLSVSRPRRVLVIGMAVYTAVFSFISLTSHFGFRTHALDLGLYDQINWLLAHGRAPLVSMPDMHAWGDHLTLIQYLTGLVYHLVDRVEAILVVQALALALGAVAVFAFARRRLDDEGAAVLFALLFLMNPSLHGINLRDFHPQAMAIPLLLGAMYWFEADRPIAFWSFTLLALSVREDAALPVIGMGLWALARRRPRTAAALLVVGLGWLVLATTVIIPGFRHEPYSHLQMRYGWLGTSVAGIVVGIFRHPLVVAGVVSSAGRLLYLAAILSPLAFLPILAPAALLPALPALVENLLSRDPVLFNYRAQYNVFTLPFLTLAAVLGWQRLRQWKGERPARVALGAAFLVSLALTSRTANDLMVSRWWPDDRVLARHAVLARVPPTAAVSAGERFVPHLSHRPYAWVFPGGIDRATHVVLDGLACRGADSVPRTHRPDWEADCDGPRVTLSNPATGVAYRYVIATEADGAVLLERIDTRS